MFVSVAEQGGFSAAAHKHGVSAAHVSRQINRLELELGCRLLERTTRSVHLTEAGRLLERKALPLLAEMHDLFQDMAEQQGKISGRVRVTAGGAYGELAVAPALVQFAAHHPDIQIQLEMSDARLDLISEGLDFGVRLGSLPDSSLIARRISRRRMGLFAAPAYLASAGMPTSVEDLMQHSCLVSRDIAWLLTSESGVKILRPTGRFESNSIMALVKAAIAGLGIVWLHDFQVREPLTAGTLVPILPKATVEENAVWIVYPSQRHVPARVRMVMDWLAHSLGDAPRLSEPKKNDAF